MTRKALMMLGVILLSGCASKQSEYCGIANPIYYDNFEELSLTPDNIVRRIDLHNEVWHDLCL